jgi:hypothetical protein
MQAYVKTDQQIHLLCQTITKANRSFVAKKDDDSHTNLYFDPLRKRIMGRWIETPIGKFILTLKLDNQQIEWLNSAYHIVTSFQTVGKKVKEVEHEIEIILSKLGLKPEGFTDKLHYDIPDYDFAKEVIPQISEQDINQWKYYRDLANQASVLLLGYLQIEGEVRIWPHHFDTGIYVVTHNGMGVGFGLAMKDSLIGKPYFYTSGYSMDGSLAYKNLPELTKGKWIITENWKGATLPLTALDEIPEANRVEAIEHFIQRTVDWFITQN